MRAVLASLALVVGCAAPLHPAAGLLARADAELLQGCYDCLIAARASYRQAAVGRERPSILARVLEVDLVLALRERELSLPPSDALADARRVAAELPRELEAARYIALVEAIPSTELGLPRRLHQAFPAVHEERAESPAERAWLTTGALRAHVREYLQLALACAYPQREQAAPAGAAPADPPLIAYRKEQCGFGRVAVLESVRAREPRFVETELHIANLELALAAYGQPEHAKERLTAALARFPRSVAVLFLLATYDRFVGDFAAALALYDRVLAIVPALQPAAIGRTACLTNLARHPEAIAAATQVIDHSADARAEAHYWRARNRYALAQLAEAHSDITAAKQELATGEVLSLAGVIEFEQGDLDLAREDLDAAIGADATDCSSRWYRALVERQGKRWLAAGRGFAGALACYRDRANASTERIPALEARLRDPGDRVRAIASLRASIEADVRQEHLAALMAASCAATGGDRVQASALLDLASEDPALSDRVATLRDWLATHQTAR